MNYEDMQKAWQSQGGPPKLNISANLLFQEVQRNKSWFEVAVFWRDVREVGLGLLLAGFFVYVMDKADPWPNIVIACACLWVSGFMVVDRWRQRQKRPLATDPLRTCIEASLQQVDHQAWLLKNVLWWYLLPLGAGMVFTDIHTKWRLYSAGVPVSWHDVTLIGGGLVLGAGIYALNQWVVKRGLRPRRQELEGLLASLGRLD